MGKFNDAADLLKRQAAKYEAFVAAAKVLDNMGSVEQAEKEMKAAAAAAMQERDKAKADVAKAKEDVAKAKEKADDVQAAAIKEANDIIISAKLKAETESAHMLKKAQDDASKMMAQASTEKARMSSEIGGLQAAIESARTDLATLKSARDEAQAATAEAEKKLDGIKAKLKSLLA